MISRSASFVMQLHPVLNQAERFTNPHELAELVQGPPRAPRALMLSVPLRLAAICRWSSTVLQTRLQRQRSSELSSAFDFLQDNLRDLSFCNKI